MDLTLGQLRSICPLTPVASLEALLPYIVASFVDGQIDSPLRAAMYLGEVTHETSDLRHFEENLSYSAETMLKVWPHRFRTLDAAAPYAHNPEALGNLVYADRMGNGDQLSGDGCRFRGRGGLMITGFDEYHLVERYSGIGLCAHPELAALPEHAFEVAAWVWRSKGCNACADRGDLAALKACTRKIDGGLIGLDSRELHFDRALEAFGFLPAVHPAPAA